MRSATAIAAMFVYASLVVVLQAQTDGVATLSQVAANGKQYDRITGMARLQVDPLLTAMQQELAREKEKLVLPGMQRPYFMVPA